MDNHVNNVVDYDKYGMSYGNKAKNLKIWDDMVGSKSWG